MLFVILFDEKINGLCNVGISFQVFGLPFGIILCPCKIKSDCKPVFIGVASYPEAAVGGIL